MISFIIAFVISFIVTILILRKLYNEKIELFNKVMSCVNRAIDNVKSWWKK
jgi:hypothetical protein